MNPIVVIDGHNDLAWSHREAAGYDLSKCDLSRSQPQFSTDIPRLREGGVGGQLWSVWVPPELEGNEALRATLEQIEFVRRMIDTYPEDLRLVTTALEAEEAMAEGRIASFLAAEGGTSIASSIQMLRILHLLGVHFLALTHNRNVGWADSSSDVPDVGGLSPLGLEVVAEMNRLGMVIDLSHASTKTARAALEASSAPVIFSHSSCRALCDHHRDVPDDLISEMARSGGLLMITIVPHFVSPACLEWTRELEGEMRRQGLDASSEGEVETEFRARWAQRHPRPKATVSQVADHVEHARELAGVDHIGLGSDFDGSPVYPLGLESVACFPNLMGELRQRGWSEAEMRQLGSENFLATLRAVEAATDAAN